MKRIKGLEQGQISIAGLSSLLTEILGNMSNVSLSLKEIRIFLYNITELRKFMLGQRDFEFFGYSPMPIEQELKQIEFHYRHHFLNLIIQGAKNDYYRLKIFDEIWHDFVLAHKYEYSEMMPHGWDGCIKAEKAKNALAKIILERLESELSKGPEKTKKHQLLLYVNGVKARHNGWKLVYKAATKLLKQYDPKNEYKNIWI